MEHCCDSMNYHAFIDGDQDSRKSDKKITKGDTSPMLQRLRSY